jgi:hypothetical protein
LLFAARCAAAMQSSENRPGNVSTSLEILKHSFHLLCREPGLEGAELAALAGFVFFVGVQAISARWDSTNHLRNFLSRQETASLGTIRNLASRVTDMICVPIQP